MTRAIEAITSVVRSLVDDEPKQIPSFVMVTVLLDLSYWI